MPCLNLSTNVALSEAQISSLLPELTSCVAKNIGKPEQECNQLLRGRLFRTEVYVMIVLKGSVPIAFSGTLEAAAYGELVSAGALNAEVNQKLTSGLAELLEAKLNVPKNRFFLNFFDSPGSFFGYNGNIMI